MICPRCQSTNVITQVVTDYSIKKQHKSAAWWLIIGWWWVPMKWLFLTLPALIVKLLKGKKQTVVTTQRTVCVCQNCGNQWNM